MKRAVKQENAHEEGNLRWMEKFGRETEVSNVAKMDREHGAQRQRLA